MSVGEQWVAMRALMQRCERRLLRGTATDVAGALEVIRSGAAPLTTLFTDVAKATMSSGTSFSSVTNAMAMSMTAIEFPSKSLKTFSSLSSLLQVSADGSFYDESSGAM